MFFFIFQFIETKFKLFLQIEMTSIIAHDNSLLNCEENSVTVPSHQQIPGESDSMVSLTNSEPNGNNSAAQDQRCKNLNTNASNIVMPTGKQQPMLPINKIAQVKAPLLMPMYLSERLVR